MVPKLDDDATLDSIFQTSSHSIDDDDGDGNDSGDDNGNQDGHDEHGSEPDENETNEALIRHDPMGVYDNALGSNRYKLTIEVNRENPVDVKESEENSELFATLRECYRLIVKKHWPLVMDWLDSFMKVDTEAGVPRAEYDRLLKLAINLKKDVADAKSKSEDLGVNMDTMYGELVVPGQLLVWSDVLTRRFGADKTFILLGPHEQDSSEDDEDFEEVQILEKISDKKKGKQPKYTALSSEPKKARNAVFAMHGAEILQDDPTYIGGTRVTPARAVAISSPSPQAENAPSSRAASEVSTPPAEGEESREGNGSPS